MPHLQSKPAPTQASLTQMIITDTYQPYAQLQAHLLPDKQFADIFHHSAPARDAF